MRQFFLVTVLSLQLGYLCSYPKPDPTATAQSLINGSHNLLKVESSNNSNQRNARCTPCGPDRNDKRPIPNHLNPEYRGNGADNLGYDWSPKAWGGLAFPHRSKMPVGAMRGRDGRMMPEDWARNQGSIIVCDTCRSYWDGNAGDRTGRARGMDQDRQFYMPSGYGGQSGYWRGDGRSTAPQDFETRVSSPTVGVLVKPGSRIAYIPSRSGEMYWDGVSGGGTRWDGFSNGISWVASGAPEWDRMDYASGDDKQEYNPGVQRPDTNYPYNPNMFRPLDSQKGISAWDSSGKGYYFANGYPNQMDPQWRDRGYASNWHYGSTNQNGWNGNNMKWNYGGKQWNDNDKSSNRFYFNTAPDRGYGPSGRDYLQYGNQYPNYDTSGGYPGNFKPQPSWRPNQGYRGNDRDPSNFRPGGDKERPWDYTSDDRFNYKKPGSRPEGLRPGPSYPTPGNYDKDGSGKYQPPYRGYSDKSDYDKPWSGRPGYGPSRPDSGSGFPYGGHRYPGGSGGGRPDFIASGGHLFYPDDGTQQPSYPNVGSGSGGSIRPTYPSGGGKPAGYPGSESQTGNYPSGGGGGSGGPSIIYTGGRPFGGGGSPDRYPDSGSSFGGYPGDGSSSGGYPGGSRPGGYPGPSSERPSGGGSYPIRPSRPNEYPGGGSYPSGGSSYPTGGGSYPSGGNRYPSGGSGYPSGGSSYPSGGSGYPSGGSSYPSGGSGYPSGGSSYPSGGSGYPSGGSGYPFGGSSYPSGGGSVPPNRYPGSGVRPGGYPAGGAQPGGYPSSGGSFGGFPGGSSYPSGGGRPGVYPGGGSTGSSRPGLYPSEGPEYPGGYPSGGSRPGGYQGQAGRPGGYPSGGNFEGRPGGSGGYPQGNRNPPRGYYTGFITELGPDDGRQPAPGGKFPSYFGGNYPGDKNIYQGKDKDRYPYGGSGPNTYPTGDKDRYPSYGEDRYSGGGVSEGYPSGGKDKYSGHDRDGNRYYYYGQVGSKDKYPGGYPSNHRYPSEGSGSGDYDRNPSSSDDKNAWNYGQDDRKDGIYRRSGGSYPPYRGGQYYTSSYLASMSTTAESTQAGSESKTQSVTKADEVTEPTPGS